MTLDTFQPEIEEALRVFDRHIVCIDKTTDECRRTLRSLLARAIDAFENRQPSLRHGIALDRQITVILSQSDTDRPLCGIYFNLRSPYHKQGEHGAEPAS